MDPMGKKLYQSDTLRYTSRWELLESSARSLALTIDRVLPFFRWG